MQAYIDKKLKKLTRSKENIINYVIKSFYEMYQLTCVLEFDNVMSLLRAQQEANNKEGDSMESQSLLLEASPSPRVIREELDTSNPKVTKPKDI